MSRTNTSFNQTSQCSHLSCSQNQPATQPPSHLATQPPTQPPTQTATQPPTQQGIAVSCVLNISGPTIDCTNITNQLCNAGIVCHVESNDSVRCENINGRRECWIEKGCTIVSTVRTKHDSLAAWNCLKTESVQCSHICIAGRYSGCVLDWERDSLCL